MAQRKLPKTGKSTPASHSSSLFSLPASSESSPPPRERTSKSFGLPPPPGRTKQYTTSAATRTSTECRHTPAPTWIPKPAASQFTATTLWRVTQHPSKTHPMMTMPRSLVMFINKRRRLAPTVHEVAMVTVKPISDMSLPVVVLGGKH
ncbi:hypothetical protein JB92DRAFT_1771508 [Gautieria morchelliformis]|nr:hypothetical protein JB92DRAFT_1771508 [Gautieria morchelliformis]